MKKIITLLTVILLVTTLAGTFSISASAANNPYITSQTINGITTVPCTWYAWQQASVNTGVELPLFGHAYVWYDKAKEYGYSVGSEARAQSIAVWQGGSHGLGHVAYVVSVNGSKMYVNEGGMTMNGVAANGTGIVTNNSCNSTVGTYKESGSTQKLIGFIYLTESITNTVTINNYNSDYSNSVTETDATVHGSITKPSSYSVTQLGIRVRKANDTYANGWSLFHAPSQSYVGETRVHPWFEMNSELKLTLTHGTTYNYQFYAKINGVDYWSDEAIITTRGSHSYSSWQTMTAATCTTAGSQKRTCACGNVETQSIAALGHSYSSTFTVDKSATCSTTGSKSKHCTRCSATTEITSIPATGHSYGAWETVTSSTCTATGSKRRSCSNCSNTEYNTLNALGHDYSSSWTVDKVATCTTSGTKSRHCTRCTSKSNVTTIAALGHSWSNWTVTKQATVNSTGTKIRNCTTEGCTAQESAVIAKLAADGHTHSFGNWFTETTATCTKNGVQKRVCSICKASETSDISAKGHSFGKWIVEKSATCTEDGVSKRSCSICYEVETLNSPALGHSFGEWTIKTQATDDVEGSLEHKCSNCSVTETQSIPKLNEPTDTSSENPSDINTYNPNVSEKDAISTQKNKSNLTTVIICAVAISTLFTALIVLVIIKKKK